MSETLYDLSVKYNANKIRDKSPYTFTYTKEIYPFYFGLRRLSRIKVMEIGIFKGGFLRSLNDYFPNATILGVDFTIQKEISELDDSILIEQGDQGDPVRMKEIAEKHGPFDFVIEDGSHQYPDQVATFESILPYVASGGWYFIEDVISEHGGSEIFNFVKDNLVVTGSFVATSYRRFRPRESFDYPYVKSVAFHPGLIAIQRA